MFLVNKRLGNSFVAVKILEYSVDGIANHRHRETPVLLTTEGLGHPLFFEIIYL